MKNEFDFSKIKSDLPASLIVFLVAMPLCLGIALASGAPLFSGLIAGIVGGVIVGSLSGSALGVSGPAAGLAVIVLNAIQDLGSFDAFLLAVIIAGALQVIMGLLKTGVIAYYFPSAVINGMLAGIGIIIILKQIPHAFGYDAVPEGDYSFQQVDNENTFSEILHLLNKISYGPIAIALLSLLILVLWETKWMKKVKLFTLVQGPLVAVGIGILLNIIFRGFNDLALSDNQMVSIPVSHGLNSFFSNFTTPDFTAWSNPHIYFIAVVLALVGSLETLLCVEASDRQDPQRRVTPVNRELLAQGIGNMVSGLIGGLPITQVVVRSSVNAQAGGKTKLSAIIHGLIILIAIILIPTVLNLIPLATLAAILFVVGYKLAKPSLFKKNWRQGQKQFIPFVATILGIVFTDLLIGISIGLAVSILFILYQNFKIPIVVYNEFKESKHIVIELSEDMTFFKKATLMQMLADIPKDRKVTIDATKTYYIHQDVLDIIDDFIISAESRDIEVQLVELYDRKDLEPHLHCSIEPDKSY